MKLLLDENLPHRLRPLLVGHDVYTVGYLHWDGIANGELLALAAQNDFDALVTKDMGIAYEQNAARLPCAVIILEAKSNSIRHIAPLVPALLSAISTLKPNAVTRVRLFMRRTHSAPSPAPAIYPLSSADAAPRQTAECRLPS